MWFTRLLVSVLLLPALPALAEGPDYARVSADTAPSRKPEFVGYDERR